MAAFDELNERRTVLYIEDNPTNLRLVQRIFQRRPHIDLLSADTGRLGVALARECRPSIVLLDLHLPDINGDEVLAQLRRDPLTRAIPVVILSADAFDRQIQRLLLGGASAYLTKPLDVRQLLDIVDQLVAQVDAGGGDVAVGLKGS